MAAKFTIPGTTYIGDGALAAAGSDICALGIKALIVTGQSMIKQGFMKVLTDILEQNGVGYVIDSKISGEPTDVMIEEGLLLYQENACDFIIGFGGGSPLDSAKAIGAMVTNPGKYQIIMVKLFRIRFHRWQLFRQRQEPVRRSRSLQLFPIQRIRLKCY